MEQTLNIAKALADGSRMRVIAALMSREELCVCQITEMLQLAPATVSRHMTILHNARLVQSRKEGRWVFYRLTAVFPDLLRQWLTGSLDDVTQIQADRRRLETILACDPDDLCRQQKKRKKCRARE
ncbi:winged helix-turn-helix transcriptional regulator [Desulfoprunum benzoelyticum]|uniref:ArsR family transcriptional regulator n=1 Tax=Desulfoprunum benzoelyticum TaxID=1506996 RepID=A0A840UM45_9BACT|nr:ArsR family transcriptional regulator [Desulfoprunum benzoelyticum]MBM9529080.1 winged helix-turn-helix transcriptional regulator [Desulfoprunum benzoelyticum]